MLRAHHRLFDRGVRTLDLFVVGGAVWLGAVLRGNTLLAPTVLEQITVVAIAWLVVSLRSRFYQSRRTDTISSELLHLAEAWFVTLAIAALVIVTAWGELAFDPVTAFPAALVGVGLSRLVVRLVLRRIRCQGLNFRKVMLVGQGRMARRIVDSVRERPDYGLRIVGVLPFGPGSDTPPPALPVLGSLDDFDALVHELEIDAVVVCAASQTHPSDIEHILEKCDLAGIHCYYAPDFLHLHNLQATSCSFAGVPSITLQPRLGSTAQLAAKRAMDIAGALLGITLALPLFMAIAIAMKVTDRGPLLFKQVRVGRNGRRFYCYKFRSMCIDAEARKASLSTLNEQDGPVFKIARDPRITRVGRILRKYSLDELPQLFNVLFGDMSLVGPRPPVPSEVARYSWWQRRRISVRPGLTCVWQVQGRNRVSFDQWMEMDLFYIDNWSLWMDIKLMLKTMPAVVRGTGS